MNKFNGRLDSKKTELANSNKSQDPCDAQRERIVRCGDRKEYNRSMEFSQIV